MEKRRYTIEASIATLARFTKVCDEAGSITDSFVQRVTTDANEEYYYIVLIGRKEVHAALRDNRFKDSISLPL